MYFQGRIFSNWSICVFLTPVLWLLGDYFVIVRIYFIFVMCCLYILISYMPWYSYNWLKPLRHTIGLNHSNKALFQGRGSWLFWISGDSLFWQNIQNLCKRTLCSLAITIQVKTDWFKIIQAADVASFKVVVFLFAYFYPKLSSNPPIFGRNSGNFPPRSKWCNQLFLHLNTSK
jgi:hypothetical protein